MHPILCVIRTECLNIGQMSTFRSVVTYLHIMIPGKKWKFSLCRTRCVWICVYIDILVHGSYCEFCKDIDNICVNKNNSWSKLLRSLRVRHTFSKSLLCYVRCPKFFPFCGALHWVSSIHGLITNFSILCVCLCICPPTGL
jgi:hypothetical protein